MASEIETWVDSCHHENELALLLGEQGVKDVQRKQLGTGDVAIQGRGRTFLIELKSVNNLVSDHVAAGIYNGAGRFQTERARLAGLQEEHAGAVTSILLLWGPRPRPDDARIGFKGNFTGRNFLTALQRTAFAAGLTVWHAGNSIEDAAIFVSQLVGNLQAGKLDREGVIIDSQARAPDLSRKQARNASAFELLSSALASQPGISKGAAEHVANHVKSLTGLVAISVKELAKVQVGSKRLGGAAAKRLKSIC